MLYNREEFKNYCLRALGSPIVKIDVTEQQISDRIDEAIDFWQQYHNEGTVRTFLKTMVTPSVLRVQEYVLTDKLYAQQKIIGEESEAETYVVNFRGICGQNTEIFCRDLKGNFIPGEKIKIISSKETLEYTLLETPKCYEKGLIDNQYIEIPDYITGVVKMHEIKGTRFGGGSHDVLSIQSQFVLNSVIDLINTDIINYTFMMNHYDLLSYQLNAYPDFQFNRFDGKIYPILSWNELVEPGDFFLFDVYRLVDPNKSGRAWNDPWLKRYSIALIKKQWAQNLKKFSGVQLAGGITLNGQEMFNEANEEIKLLEDELMKNLPPSCFIIG